MNNSSSINQKVATGTLWVLLQKFFLRGMGMVSTVILARWLSPEDYGLTAIAMSAYAFLVLFSAFGFNFALVGKDSLDADDYNSAFTIRLICYSILALAFSASAQAVALFFDDPRLVMITYTLSIMMFLSGLENIAVVDFQRNFQFDKEFKIGIYAKIIGFVTTISLAYFLRSYWALIIGSLSLRFTTVILSYYFRPYRPKICFTRAKEIMNFSRWLLLSNFIAYFRDQLPNIFLGKTLSTESVGLYSMGREISTSVTSEIVGAMNRPAYSGFAKLSNHLEELRKNVLDLIGVQALFILPMGFGVSAVATVLIPLLLGEKWQPSVALIEILAISSCIGSMSACTGYVYMSLGKPKLSFFISLTGLIIFLPLLFFGVDQLGLIGAAYASIVVSITMTLISFFIMGRVLLLKLQCIAAILYRPIFASITMFITVKYYALPYFVGAILSNELALLISVLIGATIYTTLIAVLWFLWGKPHSTELRLFDLAVKKMSLNNGPAV